MEDVDRILECGGFNEISTGSDCVTVKYCTSDSLKSETLEIGEFREYQKIYKKNYKHLSMKISKVYIFYECAGNFQDVDHIYDLSICEDKEDLYEDLSKYLNEHHEIDNLTNDEFDIILDHEGILLDNNINIIIEKIKLNDIEIEDLYSSDQLLHNRSS